MEPITQIVKPRWWQTGVVYQVYPRSFQDTNNDGIGDLPGIASRLDYLQWLGVDAIWISPIFSSPMKDFGYDVSDYTNIHPMFGSVNDFDTLLATAHARGIKVILDWVPNHTSDQHPWFIDSRSSRSSLKRDWYIWADGRQDGRPPNNWLSEFGGPAWEWDDRTGQYYLHVFLKEQPDLNWRNPEVQQAMFDGLRFWLDKGVDGARIDVIFGLIKDDRLRDNPPSTGRDAHFKGPYGEQEHLYDRHRPELHGVLRDLRRLFDEYPEAVAIGETYTWDLRELVSFYGVGDELHLPFNFTLMGLDWDAALFRQAVDSYMAALPPDAWPNFVLGSHDEHRMASRFGGREQARIAIMMLLTLRGTPTIYYGDEIGMLDVKVPSERARDPWGLRVPGLNLSRDPQRTPMQWNAGPNAGFASAAAEPWLPLAPDWQQVNVELQREDPRSMLHLTHRLIQIRREQPALHGGEYHSLAGGPNVTYTYVRRLGDERLLVALNFADRQQLVGLPGTDTTAQVLLSTHMDRDVVVRLRDVELRAHEGLLLRLA